MRTEEIAYEADGQQMLGHLAVDDTRPGRRPAILVAHEGPGLDDNAIRRADRLAELGYLAFALDYHGGGKPLARDAMMDRLGPLMGDADRIRARAGPGWTSSWPRRRPTPRGWRRSGSASAGHWCWSWPAAEPT